MGTIIYDARRIKAYERLKEAGNVAGKDEAFVEELWRELMSDGELMQEFVYYLDNGTLQDGMQCCGYGLTDLYVWQVERYNLMQDYGKNGPDCNKTALVLDAFSMMAQLKRNPEEYLRRLNDGLGMDRF